ncbi:MAG: diguanylate cyclase, partial [Nitriliruptoraceae bacterium]
VDPSATADGDEPIEPASAHGLARTALELSDTMIMITDPDSRIVYVNRAFEHVTGYASDEAIGATPRLLSSGLQPPSFYQRMWATITRGEAWTGRLINRRKDGRLYTDHMTISPIVDDTGELTHYVAVKRDVSDQAQSLAAASPYGVAHVDRQGQLVYANQRATALLGYVLDDLIGDGLLALLEADDRQTLTRAIEEAAGSQAERSIQVQVGARWLRTRVAPLELQGGASFGAILAFDDVTREVESARQVARHEQQLRTVLDSIDVPTAVFGPGLELERANPAWRALAGGLLQALPDGVPGCPDVHAAIERTVAGCASGTRVLEAIEGGGSPRAWQVRITALPEETGGAVVAALDITEQRAEQLRLQREAITDPLTGLGNRRALEHHLDGVTPPAEGLAVLYVDLDRFKPINDRHGHAVGDRVLVEVARRLTDQVRSDDLVTRVGGDEFVVVARVADEAAAVGLACRIEAALAEPYAVGTTVALTASVGHRLIDDRREVSAVLRAADGAMYARKAAEGREASVAGGVGRVGSGT